MSKTQATGESSNRNRGEPKYDNELQALLNASPSGSSTSLTPEGLERLKKDFVGPPVQQILGSRNVVSEEHVYRGYRDTPLSMTILRPSQPQAPSALLFHIHSGGMVAGDRFVGLDLMAQFVEQFGVVCSSIEYRLAPEFQDPYPIEDCFAGLRHIIDQADILAVDPSRIILVGMSAGGGLAAGLALLARDRNLASPLGQMLMCPMLDESNSTDSSYQYSGIGHWDRESNDTGWDALLGDRRHSDHVSIYASPSKAEDLSGLPTTFIDVGAVEVFRSENLNYAAALMLAGVETELHVWPGAFHGFDLGFPDAKLSRRAVEARSKWLEKILNSGEQQPLT